MKDIYEYRIFTGELELLLQEYERCEHPLIKYKIYEDITLLQEAISDINGNGQSEAYH